jgi:hypothetical protein
VGERRRDSRADRRNRRILVVVILLALTALAVDGLFIVRHYPNQPVAYPGVAAPVGIATTAAGHPRIPSGRPEVHVDLAPELRSNRYASQVARLFATYFNAINNHDYRAWVATLSSDSTPATNEQFMEKFASTHDEKVRVKGIANASGGGLLVTLSFRSHQAVALAPTDAPSECLDWFMVYPVPIEEGQLRIWVNAPIQNKHEPCLD